MGAIERVRLQEGREGVAAKPHRERRAYASPVATSRSQLTNGNALFLRPADGRTPEARRWRDMYNDFMTRTGGVAEERCRTLATLILRKELLEADLVSGRPCDPEILIKLAGEIRRVTTMLGLAPKPNGKGAQARPRVDPVTDRILAMLENDQEGD